MLEFVKVYNIEICIVGNLEIKFFFIFYEFYVFVMKNLFLF